MKVIKYLGNLGYGTRREVTEIVKHKRVTRRDGSIVRDGDDVEHHDLLVDNLPLDVPPGSVIILHKPVGYVCSTKDESRLVYELLPPRFLKRSPVMATVGRLDRETSGLLFLTDDGRINHRLTSPRAHVAKVYEVELASDMSGEEAALFASGTLTLAGDTSALLPATLEPHGARRARITIVEGRYHQVRRMFAAAGNLVIALHRPSVGTVTLGDLAAGEWRQLAANEVEALLD
ncbi:MAG: pseudouridine synthase [Gemmatimonadaceae bacterium]